MADLPISGLPTALPPGAADLLALVQAGVTDKISAQDLLGPLLPGWDSAVAAVGPTSPATRGLLILPVTNLAAASVGPQVLGSLSVVAVAGDIILVAVHLGIVATAPITPTGILVGIVSSVNSDALRAFELWLPTMVTGQIVNADLVFPAVASGSPVTFQLSVGLAGTSDGALLELQYYVFDSIFSATVLPSVSADTVDVLRYSGPLGDGAGGFLVDEFGNFLIW